MGSVSIVYKENHRLCLWDKKGYAYAEKKKESNGYKKWHCQKGEMRKSSKSNEGKNLLPI